jgi:hypothetical protein
MSKHGNISRTVCHICSSSLAQWLSLQHCYLSMACCWLHFLHHCHQICQILLQYKKIYIIQLSLKDSLIIDEENTKKNHKRVVSVYVIQIHVDLHKLKLWFSRLLIKLGFSRIFSAWFSRLCCIGYTNSRLWLEFVYPIQHGRSCCKHYILLSR